MKELEKRGVPTVALVSDDFIDDHRRTAETMGIPDLPYARIAAPLASQTPDEIAGLVDGAMESVVGGLLRPPAPSRANGHSLVILTDAWLTFEGADLLEAQYRMNERLIELQYSDGLPLVPPTKPLVEAMLKGTTRDRDEVMGLLEPGGAPATVEKIAINAVMAGCQPRHLPIVTAAVECLADPEMNLREKAISTGPAAPFVMVNGPARAKAGLNRGICMLGPGAPSRANTVIGRAVRLCMMNIGHTYPGISDMDTIGSPNKYSMVLAENEEESPWRPYNVSSGMPEGSSSVTVGFVYGLVDLRDYHSVTPEVAVRKFATGATYMGVTTTAYWLLGRRSDPRYGNQEKEHIYLFLAPQHARVFKQANWSKEDISAAMYREARLKFGFVRTYIEERAMRSAHPELDWLFDSPETSIPVLEDPSCFDVVVTGSPGSNRSAFSWGMGAPHSKPILAADLEL